MAESSPEDGRVLEVVGFDEQILDSSCATRPTATCAASPSTSRCPVLTATGRRATTSPGAQTAARTHGQTFGSRTFAATPPATADAREDDRFRMSVSQ